MGKHDHHEHSGEALRDAAQQALERQGEQWTAMRGDIYAVLADQERPVSAYDIADKVSQRRGKRVAPNSVYRILDLFVANNLAQRVESANAFIVNAHPGCQHDCIYLVCRTCGDATHIDDDKVTGAVRAIAAEQAFATDRAVVELLGTCARCA